MIRPGVPAPNLAPLLGRDVLRERVGVRYFELRTRSLLNRSTGGSMPFDWTVNPYRGCAMGCRYCYATYSHQYLGVEKAEAFHDTIYVKKDSPEETRRRLGRIARKKALIALGTVTDPYQPGEATLRVTRDFLELVASYRNLVISITTKGALVLRDLDLLKTIHSRSSLSLNVSLISMKPDLLKRIEPWAPPPGIRVQMLGRLAAEGFDVSLALAPILPGLTDSREDLEKLLSAVAGVGVGSFFRQILFLRSPTKETYLAWLSREFPSLEGPYRHAYRDRTRLGGAYPKRTLRVVDELASRYGLAQRSLPEKRKHLVQLRLFS